MTFAEWLKTRSGSGPTLVLGLDPSTEVMASWGEPDTAEGLARWSSALKEEILRLALPCVKVQVAFFERGGIAGLTVLSDLVGSLRAGGVFVIGDAKRGDISTTMEGYADAWLAPGGDFEVDCLTVNPYLGFGSLEPAFSRAEANGKGVFSLAATSNPEARALQSATTSGGYSVATTVVQEVQRWRDRYPDAAAGVVVGATVDLDALGLTGQIPKDMPILAPGYGAQGASLADASTHFSGFSLVFPVVARAVLRAGRDGFETAWSDSLGSLRET